MFGSYRFARSSFLNGASGDPENPPTTLPSSFVVDGAGRLTVNLAAGEVFNVTLRELYPVIEAAAIDIEIHYRVLEGQAQVSPQVWKIDQGSYLHQGGATAATGVNSASSQTQTIKARFSATGGAETESWPSPISWPANAAFLRPSFKISEAASAPAVIMVDGFSVSLIGGVQTVSIPSSGGYQQPASYFRGAPDKPVIVSLHTWNGTYNVYDSYAATLAFAIENDWTFISPDFRGAASDPVNQSLHAGSAEAVQDVLDARSWALADSGASPSAVYVIGGSGGGYMSLLVAAKNPALFKAVAVYAAITDLREWWEWCSQRAEANLTIYSGSVAASLGGTPTQQPAAYEARSPITWLSGLETMPVHIQHGIADATVPVSHAINAFNEIAEAKGLDVDQIVGRESAALSASGLYGSPLPSDLAAQGRTQGGYTYPMPFARKTGNVELVLEQVGHNGDMQVIFDFLTAVEAGAF